MKIKKNSHQKIFTMAALMFLITMARSQSSTIEGIILDKATNEPVPYASIVLTNKIDSSQVAGTISDLNGRYQLTCNQTRSNKLLIIRCLGYSGVTKPVPYSNHTEQLIDTTYLVPESLNLDEIVVSEKRQGATNHQGKTSYLMNSSMQKSTENAVDVIRLLPGVQVDLSQNLTLNGQENVLVMVDGIERDLDFLHQINPEEIDKVEVGQIAGAGYDADASGVIQIMLKKRKSGFHGHIKADIPTNPGELYLFPSFNMQYSHRDVHIYTSYSGQISYFNIIEKTDRTVYQNSAIDRISTQNNLIQDNWSHRLNYGMDMKPNQKATIHVYGYYNPVSQEYDGNLALTISRNGSEEVFTMKKDDSDLHHQLFNGLNYNYKFNSSDCLNLEVNHFYLTGNHKTVLIPDGQTETGGNTLMNHSSPDQKAMVVKADFTSSRPGLFSFSGGAKISMRQLTDNDALDFHYREQIVAGYAKGILSHKKVQVEAGIRTELSDLRGMINEDNLFFLPYLTANYKINQSQQVKAWYKTTINRPRLYQLNPEPVVQNPYELLLGNPGLKPSTRHELALGYSLQAGNQYASFRLYHQKELNAIDNITWMGDNTHFTTRVENASTMRHTGFHAEGAFRLGKTISIYPYLQAGIVSIDPNQANTAIPLRTRQKFEAGLGLSATAVFKNNYSASFNIQYQTPRYRAQQKTISDALYFVSFGRVFKDNLKVTLASGLTFRSNFIYSGTGFSTNTFAYKNQNKIQLSGFPLWVRVSYRISKGKKHKPVKAGPNQWDPVKKKGF